MVAGLQSIVARTTSNVIGNKGALPWYIPEDLQRFKRLTLGRSVIMGRNTWDEIYKKLGKALPDRKNIVLTSGAIPKATDLVIVRTLKEAIEQGGKEAVIIGGAQIYQATLPMVKIIRLTEILGDYKGDTYFPELDMSEWHEEVEEETDKYRFITLTRH